MPVASMPVASTTEFVTTPDGVQQLRRYWSVGEPRAAVLLVHGIGEHSGRYEHVGAAFADRGIDVASLDNRGYGRTSGRRGDVESFDRFIDDVDVLLAERRRLGVPVVLMGHSLGGLIVTTYLVAVRPQPDLAVLSAPALTAAVPVWQRTLAAALGRTAPRVMIPADYDGTVLSRDPVVQREFEEDPLRVSPTSARLGHQILRTMKRTGARLDRVSVPTYVLHGADDELVPPAASEPLGTLDVATRRLWPGLRHECMNEPERDEVIGDVIDWVDEQLGAR